MTLTLNGYKKTLSQVQKTIRETEQNIAQNVNRQKVEMCWKLGKIIDTAAHLQSNFGSRCRRRHHSRHTRFGF